MRINDYIKKSMIDIIRNRKKLYLLIIITFCSLIFMFVILFKFNFNQYIKDNINNNLGFRILEVSPKLEVADLGKNELLSIEHILDVYNSKYNSKIVESSFKSSKLDGTIEFLYGTATTYPNIVLGRGFKEGDSKVAICPQNFYPDESVYQLKLKEENFISEDSLLNKKFTIKYYEMNFDSDNNNLVTGREYNEDYEIIGLYDNKQIMNLNNQCYIMSDDIISIIDKVNPNNDMEFNNTNFYVLIDSVDNIDYVMNKIKNKNFINVYQKNSIDENLVDMVDISYIVLITIVILTIIILDLAYVKKIIINDSHIIGLLRAIGYDKKTLKKMYFIEFLIINIIAYLISIFLLVILFSILKTSLLSNMAYIGINLTISPLIFILNFIIIVCLSSFVTTININKVCNCRIIELVGSE